MTSVLDFVKKWWRWLLVGLAVLLGFYFGLQLRKKPVVVIPGPSDKQKDAEKKKTEEEKKLDDQAKKEADQVNTIHDQVISTFTDEQKKKYDQIKDDPKAVNDFLSDISKQMRGG